jgi:hypothetical protein
MIGGLARGYRCDHATERRPVACLSRIRSNSFEMKTMTTDDDTKHDGNEKPDEANAAILSLYGDLSVYVHAAVPQFQSAMTRERKGESAGMESVSTLNRFDSLAFQVYDLVLVRLFYNIGLSMAGDIFTTVPDDEPKWRFHKAPFVRRMSRCFDCKHERRVRRGEI